MLIRVRGASSAKQSPFGTPASIDPARLFRLPIAMQIDGMLLLREMGESVDQAAARLGLSARQVEQMLDAGASPYRRGGEDL